jgi:thiol-disulfide isomerase/thioredoxin
MKRVFVYFVSFLLVINSFFGAVGTKVVHAENAKKMVLIELFTQQWCGYCPDANQKLDAMYEESGGKEFYFIKEHVNDRDELGSDYAGVRRAKYGNPGYPTGFINSEMIDVRDTSKTKNLISKHKGIKTQIGIEITGKIEGNVINVTAKYNNLPSNSLLSVVICEDFTYYNSSNGERINRFLLRDGKDFTLSGEGTQKVQFSINDNWAKELMRGFAIVETASGIQNTAYTNLDQAEPMTSKSILTVIPNQINLADVKADSSTSIDVKVANAGSKPGKITFKTKDSFIKIDSAVQEIASKTQTKLTATIQTAGLQPGVYKGSIEANGDGVSKVIPVEFYVLDKPKVQVSTGLIDFGSVKQGEKVSQEIVIKNLAKGPISGTVSSKAKWINFSKKSFSGDINKLNVIAMTDKLVSGDYSDEIVITTDGGDATIDVKITVAAPKLDVTPEVIDFGEIMIDKPPFESKEFTLKNSGKADATINLKGIPDFCEVKLDKKFTLKPGEEKVGVISLLVSKLAKDNVYKGKIVFDWGSMITELGVMVSVKESSPVMEYVCELIKDGKIDLQMKKGEKKEIPISFKNVGNGKLDVQLSLTATIPWITFSIKSTVLLKDQKKTISTLVDSTTANPGIYDTILKIVSNVGSYEIPIHIEVIREKIVIELQIGNKTAMISGKPIAVDPPPYIKNGATLVPLRFIAEAFGAVIDWQPKMGKGTITITLGDKNIMIEIGNTTAIVNGQKKTLTAPPEITGGRTFVPLRFISEAFGAELDWNGKTQTIKITY